MKHLIAVSIHISTARPVQPVLVDLTDSDYVRLEPGERITEKYLNAHCRKIKRNLEKKLKKDGQECRVTVTELAVTQVEED